jgi:hypothetical protein
MMCLIVVLPDFQLTFHNQTCMKKYQHANRSLWHVRPKSHEDEKVDESFAFEYILLGAFQAPFFFILP